MENLTLGNITLSPADITALSRAIVENIVNDSRLGCRLENALLSDNSELERRVTDLEDMEERVDSLENRLDSADLDDLETRVDSCERDIETINEDRPVSEEKMRYFVKRALRSLFSE